jgi:elongation factor Ts
MSFSAKDVANLREMTGAGMMDCKKALQETAGNMEEAAKYLRQKGIASAAKKASKVAAEGLIAARLSEDAVFGVILEINSQTDFVAKNENFQSFVSKIVELALRHRTRSLEELLSLNSDAKSVADMALEQTAKTGEKIDIRRLEAVESSSVVASYVHPVGSKIGVLVALEGEDASSGTAQDIAMHIAAANPAPEFITRDEIPAELIENEKAIEMGKEDLKNKPKEIAEKIVAGRVDKLLATKVLAEQPFVKDPAQKISQILGKSKVTRFVRFNLGEGIEKKVDDFAAEVAAMSSSAK